jgi:alkylhydroperoxidase/carboxymuconolactone decarboxylase family protein YurZ
MYDDWPERIKVLSAHLRNLRGTTAIAFHVKAALDRGATYEEITETLAMTIYMGAGLAAMYGSHALEALRRFDAARNKVLA